MRNHSFLGMRKQAREAIEPNPNLSQKGNNSVKTHTSKVSTQIDDSINVEPQSTNQELWMQTKERRSIEDCLDIINNPQVYDDFLILMLPKNIEKWTQPEAHKNTNAKDIKINTYAVMRIISEESRGKFAEAFNNENFCQEFLRRAKVFEEYLHGKHGISNSHKKNKESLNSENFIILTERIKWLNDLLEDSENLNNDDAFKNSQKEFGSICTEIGEHIKDEKLNDSQIVEILQAFGIGFSSLGLMGQSLWRLRDYAGSFDMMEAIYNYYDSQGQDIAGNKTVSPWNKMLLETTSAKDVNDRKQIIVDDILRERIGEKLKVLNFASGPGGLEINLKDARDMKLTQLESIEVDYEHLCKNLGALKMVFDNDVWVFGQRQQRLLQTVEQTKKSLRCIDWRCVDGDKDAVEFASKRLSEIDEFQVEYGNVIREIANPKNTNQYDEILTVGLLDYFDDKFIVKALKHFYTMLKPNGRFRIGQFDSNHSEEGFLGLINWHLYRRDQGRMRELAVLAGIPVGNITTKKISENGPQLIVTVHKFTEK